MSDPRESLLSLLGRYRFADEADRQQMLRIKTFVQENKNCLERTHLEGHITGSAWLVDGRGDKVLLTHHKKLGQWLQLGGHADGNPDVLAAALREAREESGLTNIRPLSTDVFDVDVHWIPARPNEPAHFHHDIRFAMQAAGSSQVVVSAESHDLAWVDIVHLNRVTNEESLLRMGRKWNRIKAELLPALF